MVLNRKSYYQEMMIKTHFKLIEMRKNNEWVNPNGDVKYGGL